MNVLSLFDGISGAQQALNNLGCKPATYYASEINPHAIKITQSRFPKTIQMGDVRSVLAHCPQHIDLLIFGSPCTDLSIGKKNRQSLKGDASSLFYEAVKILRFINPTYFLMENVSSMSEESKKEISKILGFQPVRINSNHFIPQNRDRLYWFNWRNPDLPFPNVKPFSEFLFDQDMYNDSYKFYQYSLSQKGQEYMNRQVKDGRTHWDFGLHSDTANKNSACIVSNFKKGVPYNVLLDRRPKQLNVNNPYWARKFDPVECERLQGFPDDYTSGVPNTHRYEILGNSFTVPVISHLLRPII